MTDIKLDWDNNMEGPLPTSVEILRDGVVIHTENGSITTYTDVIDDPSIMTATYNVRNINGQYSDISDPLVVAVGGWTTFFPMTIDKYEITSNGERYLFPSNGAFNEASFTSLGFNPEYSVGASFTNADSYPPADLQSNEYTVSFKIKAPPQDHYAGILEWRRGGPADVGVRCDYINNVIYMNYMGQEILSTINVFDDIEHKIDIVRKDNTFFFYIDGVLDTSTPIESTQINNYHFSVYVGYRPNTGQPFNGYIKDLGISPYPLYG